MRLDAVHQCQHIQMEGALKIREFVKPVEDFLRLGIAVEINRHAQAVLVGFITDIFDAVNLFFRHQLGNLFQQIGFLHLIGNLGDDNLVAIGLFVLHDFGFAAANNRPLALRIGRDDLFTVKNFSAQRKIGALDELKQIFGGRLGSIKQICERVANFTQIMRRNVSGHAHGNPQGTVQEQLRQGRWQNRRFLARAVVIVNEINRVFINIFQNRFPHPRQTRLGVAHRRGRIPVNTAKIALALHQRVAQGKILRQAHHRVID